MKISDRVWTNYIGKLRRLNDTASQKVKRYIETHDVASSAGRAQLIRYAYNIATKYGEGAAALSALMYDTIAELSGKYVPPAVPASTATYAETAKTVNGTMLFSQKPDVTASAVGRLVKQTGVDTTVQNALRDGAEWAWIPRGDTCAFCLTLASRGWQPASRSALKGDHAEHIHANCDCTYAIRFNSDTDVEGYDPDKYLSMYENAPLDKWNTPDGKPPKGDEGAERDTPKNRINAMRRQAYGKTKSEEIDID